jgi:hypothetical protein
VIITAAMDGDITPRVQPAPLRPEVGRRRRFVGRPALRRGAVGAAR